MTLEEIVLENGHLSLPQNIHFSWYVNSIKNQELLWKQGLEKMLDKARPKHLKYQWLLLNFYNEKYNS